MDRLDLHGACKIGNAKVWNKIITTLDEISPKCSCPMCRLQKQDRDFINLETEKFVGEVATTILDYVMDAYDKEEQQKINYCNKLDNYDPKEETQRQVAGLVAYLTKLDFNTNTAQKIVGDFLKQKANEQSSQVSATIELYHQHKNPVEYREYNIINFKQTPDNTDTAGATRASNILDKIAM